MEAFRTGMANSRAVLAALLTYALLAHGFIAPMAQARALESAKIEATLGVICAADGTTIAHTDGESPAHHSHTEHECCLNAQRDLLGGPMALVVSSLPAYSGLFALLKIEIETTENHFADDTTFKSQRPRGPPTIV